MHSTKAKYDENSDEILVWEGQLQNIEQNNDRKIKLISWLAEAYGTYIDLKVKDKLTIKDNLNVYDYDLFRFDASGESAVQIGELESPTFNGILNIDFPKLETEKVFESSPIEYRRDPKAKGGPNAGDFNENFFPETPSLPSQNDGPGDPPFNIGLKFSFSLGGGFSASLYAGISKQIKVGKDFGLMPSLNAALTYYGYGTPGTSPLSRNLVTLSATPALTIGYKTGNPMNMNMFNDFSGSGVYNPYEYAFTLGKIGVLSSGRVTNEYDKEGIRIKDKYNSQDRPNRHQVLGAASIKLGNFMISSYNDIHKVPLFLGMDSDQYWSAGVNMQARITDRINMSYAFDLYYGKSNNQNPYNLDKNIDGQNFDTQRLFDVLLNRGQESYTSTDANGNFNKTTKFGYGTFWPSNNMHNAIEFPSIPKIPVEPVKKDYKVIIKYDKAREQYKLDLVKYERDLTNYKISLRLKPFSTFHHLFVVYDGVSKEPDFDRLQEYIDAETPKKEFQDFYKMEMENEKKTNNEIKNK
ncbi:polymorphic toxin type 23 domain-containing protein [Kaistella jeonii]|uniref:Uncharacterized protein n=1 Tax=Kaistella jeonii TaxID=266749 RepID=A0A0C1EVS9_9FLAO|nr:polymorphic toxin type 23 domain-containing protein [Kaistella jeonii]KIA85062.1 hypothetical protein OA86_14800 [Kaistella jeonii]SFC43841.1 toxin 23 [Kaistella jeonii]VEI97360.1 Uncharacterised protein [Kaistella jeonii]